MPRPNKAVAVPRWVGGKLSNRMAWDKRLHGATAQALQDPRETPASACWSRRRRVSEATVNNDGASDQKSFAPEKTGEPGAGRQDDCVGHQITRQHPGGFILRRAEISGDVRQRHHDDGRVQNDHERRQHHRHRNQPRIGARPPFSHRRGSGVAHLTLTSGSTDMPGAMSRLVGSGSSNTILTGTRWTTLT